MPNLFNRIFRKNDFRKAIWSFLFPNSKLIRDVDLDKHLENGYEKNPTVFGAASNLASKAADVKLVPYVGENIAKIDPLKELFKDKSSDYSLREFIKHWHLSRYLLGEAIVYISKYNEGNDAGKPMTLDIMPAQNVDIKSAGWMQPVSKYTVDVDETKELEPEDIYHSRLFLNLDFTEGKNFRGLAPLKVASSIITSMNSADDLTNKSYETGMPPGILYNKNLESSEVAEQKERLETAWRNKEKDIPVFGGGELGWINLGFSSIKDLQIVETDARGLRIMCNIWGVQEALFSSDKATLDNMKVSRKLMYEDRIIPDVNDFLEFINEIFAGYGIEYRADWSKIPALQEDKEKLAKVWGIAIDKHAATNNEFRVNVLGLDPIESPELDEEGLIDRATFIPPVPTLDDENQRNNRNA